MRLCFAAILTLSGVAARAQVIRVPRASVSAPPVEVITWPALMQRLAYLDWLWQPPRDGERCVQFASYDHGPGIPAWYQNAERSDYLRIEERDGAKEYVMIDAQGPGCIARIWSANPSGTLHFDVDGARVWSVDFAKLLSGQVKNVPEPIAGVRSKGGTCYLPIPFAKSLAMSCTAGDLWYTVDVLSWTGTTRVESFQPARLATLGAGAQVLDARAPVGPYNSEIWFPSRRVQVEPGHVVRKIIVQFPQNQTRADQLAIMQTCLLVVRCGDEETVRVPLCDFFALGSACNLYVSRCLAVEGDRATCAFPMPMPHGGSVEIVGERDYDYGAMSPMLLNVQTEELTGAAGLLFRASYQLAKGTPTRPFSHHVVIDAKGQGRLVGCSLLVRNPSRTWWGEGSEIFIVDGEQFRSWFGTGTEDYFGYAWGNPTPFSAPFHAQVECQGPANFGFTQLHRTHVLDSVPFQSSFRFLLERWHWVENTNIDYATVAYWYGAPGATSGLPDVPPADERRLERLDAPPVFVAENALEGEDLRVVSCSGGTHEVQELGILQFDDVEQRNLEGTLSHDRHRYWRGGRRGDALVLAVPVPARGRYRISAGFVQASDFGIVQVSLGGERLGQPFDGYAVYLSASGVRELGEVTLPAGDVELRLELVGSNPQAKSRHNPEAKPRHMVGLDYLRLEKIE